MPTRNGAPRDVVAALIVPQGKIVDFIKGTLRNGTPEEYVRQEIEKSIVREYRYPPEEVAVGCDLPAILAIAAAVQAQPTVAWATSCAPGPGLES